MRFFKFSIITLVSLLVAGIPINANAAIIKEAMLNPAVWQLDAIDNGNFTQDGTFSGFGKEPQQEVTIYIIDSGINPIQQFEGFSIETIDLSDDVNTKDENIDCSGHGTKVASTIIGDRGYFKKPSDKLNIVSIKVFSCQSDENNGSYLRALEWIWLNHDSSHPGVINLSLSSENDEPEDIARHEMVAGSLLSKNTVIVAAAANDETDACKYSPANLESTITVGALKRNSYESFLGIREYLNFEPATFSNYGDCVDYWTFGEGLKGYDSDGKSRTLRGTSFAAPMVSGLIAYYLTSDKRASINDAKASLSSNSKAFNLGDEYGIGRVPYYNSLIKAESDIKPEGNIVPLEAELMRFSPSELCIQGNQLIDYTNLVFEVYDNGVRVDILKEVVYVEDYYYNTLKLILIDAPKNPTVKVYQIIDSNKELILELSY